MPHRAGGTSASQSSQAFEVEKIMNRQKGFTLVELLVVITVIGILVALAVPNVNKLKIKAKEARVTNGAHVIQTALETFALNHDGLYPGVAVPTCDDDAQPRFEDTSSSTGDWYTMRALIGGGVVKPADDELDYLDGFYFTIDPDPDNGRLQIPDRLVAEGALEIYPENPFRNNISGVTDQAVPMLNMFGIEFQWQPVNDPGVDIFDADPAPVRICEPLWYGDDNDYTTPTIGGTYDFPDPDSGDYRFMGDINHILRYDNNPDPDSEWHVERGEILQSGFPEGNFAYIPLDPVQTDPGQPDFMRYCRNYWLIIYGSTSTAERNKYEDVVPQFPRPLGDGDSTTPPTAYEWTVRQALVGAMAVYATAYEDQLRVEGS